MFVYSPQLLTWSTVHDVKATGKVPRCCDEIRVTQCDFTLMMLFSDVVVEVNAYIR